MTKLTPTDIDNIYQFLANVPTKTTPPAPNPATVERHPLAHLDIPFFFISLLALLLISSSMLETFVLEHLVYLSIISNIIGLVLLVTRSRDRLTVYKINISDNRPRAALFNFKPAPTIRDLQKAAGITPIIRDLANP